jgi:sulfatase maturation enzyme AslB (radical SAM superfamily)
MFPKELKFTIEYIRKNYQYENINITVTTNGFLLDENIIKYFLKNNIRLTVSLHYYPIFSSKESYFSHSIHELRFNKVSENIKKVASILKEDTFYVNFVVTTENINNLYNYIILIHSM